MARKRVSTSSGPSFSTGSSSTYSPPSLQRQNAQPLNTSSSTQNDLEAAPSASITKKQAMVGGGVFAGIGAAIGAGFGIDALVGHIEDIEEDRDDALESAKKSKEQADSAKKEAEEANKKLEEYEQAHKTESIEHFSCMRRCMRDTEPCSVGCNRKTTDIKVGCCSTACAHCDPVTKMTGHFELFVASLNLEFIGGIVGVIVFMFVAYLVIKFALRERKPKAEK